MKIAEIIYKIYGVPALKRKNRILFGSDQAADGIARKTDRKIRKVRQKVGHDNGRTQCGRPGER